MTATLNNLVTNFSVSGGGGHGLTGNWGTTGGVFSNGTGDWIGIEPNHNGPQTTGLLYSNIQGTDFDSARMSDTFLWNVMNQDLCPLDIHQAQLDRRLAGPPPAPPGDNLIDNGAPGFTILAGSWAPDAGAYGQGFEGSNYLYATSTGYQPSADNRVQWTPTLEEAGWYEVFTKFGSGWRNWATDAPFTVHHADGATTVRVNQRTAHHGAWLSLGTYRFVAGSTGRVVLSNDASYAYVVADAVKWVLAGAPPD
jgi:hypothetical protein